MAYVPMKEILDKKRNIYKLVLLAAKRASELSDGANPLVPRNDSSKVTTLALREIIAGKVSLKEEEVKEITKTKVKKGKK